MTRIYERFVYEVKLADGSVRCFNCVAVEITKQGQLIIYDRGVLAAFACSEWAEINFVETLTVEDKTGAMP